ncbi:MAG: hypothetical protein DYG89_16925 [Caldilinea sp. CFX5]|nr:hypothetical protein [Caldilinea sp. CFX5]
MRLQSPFWTTFAWLILLMVAGCGSSPTPTPTVTVVRLPAATAQPAATAAPPPPTIVTNTVTLAPFRINLPSSAPVLYPTDATWDSQLAQLQQQQPQLANYLTALAATLTVEERVALIQLPIAEETLTLVAATVPSEGLSLQSYLAAAQTELEQSRLALGSGIVVQRATMRYDLHEAHIPLATLQYTLPVSGGAADISGYQAAMLDPTGNHLLLLTFVAAPTSMAAAQEQIATILARLQETGLIQ